VESLDVTREQIMAASNRLRKRLGSFRAVEFFQPCLLAAQLGPNVALMLLP
jgi:hypothetical protein